MEGQGDEHKGHCYAAPGYVGPRPTCGGDKPVLEAFLLDFEGDLYGEEIEVEFIEKLRHDATFADGESLAAQMGLGFRILYGQQTFDTRLVFSGLLTIAVIGFTFDRAILALSSVLCRWHFRQADEFGTA